MTDKNVFVTQPYLPPLEEFYPYLEQIWENKILTNGGPLHQQLEEKLSDYLGVKKIALFSNGTLALVSALQALRITGEVITTPFSFVATSHSLYWNNVQPVFVDIDPDTLNLDPQQIEAAITPQTTAILAVHCYGHPCDVIAIREIAEKYDLRVIYDAAHAFGVEDKGGSILRHGDLSVLSMHATKVFNTFEGGFVVCPDAATKSRIDHLKNFGFSDETKVIAPGINGKLSELNAAIGLIQLEHINNILRKRRIIDERYREGLASVGGIRCVEQTGETVANYSYFPILVEAGYPIQRDNLLEKLRYSGIFAKRYFYPLISEFSMYRDHHSALSTNLSVAERISRQVLCLPIYPDLSLDTVDKIIEVISDR